MPPNKPGKERRAWSDPELLTVMRAWGRTMGAVGGSAAGFFGDLEITTAQMRVLGQLKNRGRMSGRELAAQVGVHASTIIPLCDRLEEQGLLRRFVDPADRRWTWIELTPKGENFFQGLWRSAAKKVMEAVAQFTPDERRTFELLLNRIADHLEAGQERDSRWNASSESTQGAEGRKP